MLCKYGPVFAPYVHDWTLYGINTVQKQVCIYMAFSLCICMHMCTVPVKLAMSVVIHMYLPPCFSQHENKK